jgi:hypothetical protein
VGSVELPFVWGPWGKTAIPLSNGTTSVREVQTGFGLSAIIIFANSGFVARRTGCSLAPLAKCYQNIRK